MRFIANFSAHQVSIYQKTIRMWEQLSTTNKAELRVSAHDCYGRHYDGSLSFWVNKHHGEDLSDFWRLFEIVKEKDIDVYNGKRLL